MDTTKPTEEQLEATMNAARMALYQAKTLYTHESCKGKDIQDSRELKRLFDEVQCAARKFASAIYAYEMCFE